MRLLIVDCETTGLLDSDPPSELIEVAAALYCTDVQSVLTTLQFILPNGGTNAAKDINHISEEVLKQKEIEGCRDFFQCLYLQADYIISHNTKFDKYFILGEWGATLIESREWICTYADIKFPKTKRSLVLSHIAVDHGILPHDMHRALGDVNTLVALLGQTPDLENQVIRIAKLRTDGNYYVVGPLTSEEEKEVNSTCRKLDFKWNFDLKKWGKWMLTEEVASLPFAVVSVPYK